MLVESVIVFQFFREKNPSFVVHPIRVQQAQMCRCTKSIVFSYSFCNAVFELFVLFLDTQ